jgi:hypothetical protein
MLRFWCLCPASYITPGRAGISIASTMVVIVIWRVARLICCRVYVKYGTECVGIKLDKLCTMNMTKLLDCYVNSVCDPQTLIFPES